MINIKFSQTAPRIRGFRQTDDYAWSISKVTENIPSIQNLITVDRDVVLMYANSASYSHDVYSISSSVPVKISYGDGIELKQDGKYHTTSDGIDSYITVSGRTGDRKANIKTRFSITQYASTPTIVNFVDGTLCDAIDRAFKNIVNNKTAGQQTQDMYTMATFTGDASSCVAQENPNRIGYGQIDLSAISFTVNGAYSYPVVLITPRHVVFASHTIPTGKIIFRRNNGTFAEAYIQTKSGVIGTSDDIEIGYLDREVTGIDPMNVFPSDVKSYAPFMYRDQTNSFIFNASEDVPKITCIGRTTNIGITNPINTQIPKLRLYGVTCVNFVGQFSYGGFFRQPTDAHQKNFWSELYGGDSGTPLLSIVPSSDMSTLSPVLIGVLHAASDGEGYCKSIYQYTDLIEDFINSTNPIYHLSKIDISRFPMV